MKFLVDTQLPPRLAKFLSGKGFDANHTSRYPDGYFLDDEAIRRIAKAEGRTIITKDSDFFDCFLVKGAPPCILLLRMGNLSNAELLAQFEKPCCKCKRYLRTGLAWWSFMRSDW